MQGCPGGTGPLDLLEVGRQCASFSCEELGAEVGTQGVALGSLNRKKTIYTGVLFLPLRIPGCRLTNLDLKHSLTV